MALSHHPHACALKAQLSRTPRPVHGICLAAGRQPARPLALTRAAPSQGHPARAVAARFAVDAEPAVQPAAEKDVISWTSYWWPVQALANLDAKIPMHVDLLGKSLVVWGDSQGHWHCLEDQCPHRLAPLSEGRVEKDSLMCSYHGWTFSGAGACTSIPQLAGDSKAHASACSSKRACVTTYPTKLAHGLLWVWPEAGLQAAAQAAATQPHEMPYSDQMYSWYVRDIPLRPDMLIENVVDPSHVPFSHHGVMGNRYNPTPMIPHMKVESLGKAGMMTSGTFGGPQGAPLHLQFLAPCRVTYHYTDPKLPGTLLAIVPTKPGWSRVLLSGTKPGASPGFSKVVPLHLQLLIRLRHGPTFLSHITRSAVFDGDDYMLHVAQRLLPAAKGLGSAVARAYYIPASQDGMVIALRKWFEQYGGDVPTFTAADALPILPKEQVFDRWEQHTKQCRACLQALATLDTVRAVNRLLGLAAAVAFVSQGMAAAVLANASALSATASSPAGSWWQACLGAGMPYSMLACGVVAALSYGLHHLLAALRQKFFYEDYVHAHRN